MKMLITGVAGFIGSAVSARVLVNNNTEVVGIDNINDYYNPQLKYDRLNNLGIKKETIKWDKISKSEKYPNFSFIRMNIEDTNSIERLFKNENFDIVIHLAAQPGVRHSIDNPLLYIRSNINGFINVLESCRKNQIKHLVYASSSSVYGLNGKVPYTEKDGLAHPISLYAATKKSNELMAHTYSYLFNLPTTGLRFFTVYGPWGRPDMSPFLFIDAILKNQPIKVFNNGDMWRDFTYINDIVEGIVRIAEVIPTANPGWDEKNPDPSTSVAPYRIYNIGNQRPVRLMDYIECIENIIGKEAKKEFLPMQPGDDYQTYADSSALAETIGFIPNTKLQEGINKTVKWFKQYYKL